METIIIPVIDECMRMRFTVWRINSQLKGIYDRGVCDPENAIQFLLTCPTLSVQRQRSHRIFRTWKSHTYARGENKPSIAFLRRKLHDRIPLIHGCEETVETGLLLKLFLFATASTCCRRCRRRQALAPISRRSVQRKPQQEAAAADGHHRRHHNHL